MEASSKQWIKEMTRSAKKIVGLVANFHHAGEAVNNLYGRRNQGREVQMGTATYMRTSRTTTIDRYPGVAGSRNASVASCSVAETMS